jgi:hypothetical protein
MTISDIPQTIDNYIIASVLAPVSLLVVIFLARSKIKHAWLNFKTRYRLNRLGLKQIANVQWPDGLGHYFTIDRLILRNNGITLLVYKQYPGKIFCADHIDDWTQMLGQKSYRFKNPFYDLDYQVKTIASCIPGVPVNGFLFFDQLAEFPKGHPDRVIHIKNIPEELKQNKRPQVEKSVLAAWNKLLTMAKNKGKLRK